MKIFRNGFAVFLAFCIFVCAAAAQIPITNHEPFTETFDSMADTADLPPNWIVSAPGINANWNDAGNSTMLGYARILSEAIPLSAISVNWTCPNCGTDRSPGFIPRVGQVGQPTVNSLIAHYRNMTDGPLRFVRITYSVKQYYISNQPVAINVSWSKNGTTWSDPLPALTITQGSAAGDQLPMDFNARYLDTPNVASAPAHNYVVPWVDIVTEDIMPNEDLYIRWTFSQDVTTAAQGVALGDVTLQAYNSEPICRSITTPSTPITENFDTLASTGNGDVFPEGFGYYATLNRARSYYNTDNGSASNGALFSFGSTGAAERALGTLRVGTYDGMIGACFVNSTGRPITSLKIQYDGELWRSGASNRFDALEFEYSLDADHLASGTWTTVPSLRFALASSSGRKNGNSAVNRVAGISDTIDGLNIPVGSKFYFRWVDFSVGSPEDSLAIDNFELTAFVPTAAGVLVAGRVLRPNGTAVSGAVVTVSGGDGSVRMSRRTGTFGQFRFEGLRAGETYFISVRAPRLVFEPETRAVTLNDSVYDLNLIASPETNAARR